MRQGHEGLLRLSLSKNKKGHAILTESFFHGCSLVTSKIFHRNVKTTLKLLCLKYNKSAD